MKFFDDILLSAGIKIPAGSIYGNTSEVFIRPESRIFGSNLNASGILLAAVENQVDIDRSSTTPGFADFTVISNAIRCDFDGECTIDYSLRFELLIQKEFSLDGFVELNGIEVGDSRRSTAGKDINIFDGLAQIRTPPFTVSNGDLITFITEINEGEYEIPIAGLSLNVYRVDNP